MMIVNSYLITTGILYALSLLFFGLFFIFRYKKYRKLSLVSLGVGQFFNPLGYDIAFHYTMKLYNGSFLKADLTFYALSFAFLYLFYILSGSKENRNQKAGI